MPTLDRVRLLSKLACDPLALGYAAANWTVLLLAGHLRRQGYPVTARTLRRRLHAAGLRWKRPRFVFRRACPARRPEKGALVRAMKTLPAGGRLLVLNETTLRHLPPLRAAWALRGQQAQVRISGTNARRSLFGTVDLRKWSARAQGQPPPAAGRLSPLFAATAPRDGSVRRALAVAGSSRHARGNAMNMSVTLAVYATLCKESGQFLSIPARTSSETS